MLTRVHEVRLAERLIAHDTSDPAGLAVAMDFVAGWLEGRGVDLTRRDLGDREVLLARAGSGPVRLIFNGHLDVVRLLVESKADVDAARQVVTRMRERGRV